MSYPTDFDQYILPGPPGTFDRPPPRTKTVRSETLVTLPFDYRRFTDHYTEGPSRSQKVSSRIDGAEYFDNYPIESRWPPPATSRKSVVADPVTKGPFESYLVKVDIRANINDFIILQVLYDETDGQYESVMRAGRVGTLGIETVGFCSPYLEPVSAHYAVQFREHTGLDWVDREFSVSPGEYNFIELNYNERNVVPTPWILPDYTNVELCCGQTDCDLMKRALHGGQVFKSQATNEGGVIPYSHISPWGIFLAYCSLGFIADALSVPCGVISWSYILDASDRYRSLMPLAVDHQRPPALTTLHAISVELTFLQNLCSLRNLPELQSAVRDVSNRAFKKEIECRGEHLPYHQALRSLYHEFLILSDHTTTEFREVYNYYRRSAELLPGLDVALRGVYSATMKVGVENEYEDWISHKTSHSISNPENRLLLWHGLKADELVEFLARPYMNRRNWSDMSRAFYLYDSVAAACAAIFPPGGEGMEGCHNVTLLLYEADVGMLRYWSCLGIEEEKSRPFPQASVSRCVESLGRITPRIWKSVKWPMPGAPCQCGSWVLMSND
ncbi:hypothetical protein JDV02_009734 [Purpureocillium takamizusanense]|uniref:NAD(+) ADP-ribosyltransferase n=1 Tax=Purpureocillium takamizusanense TaxID=2060973 RepID=A0A9Q8QT25_9HYPO|nr:uncharacterized protein JDV02_009734 [Purpureocillium takamizusanense]UNI23947.1 hypothetical protein JDV02_009734 [Purpureocillium takamizusanense]